MDRLISLEPSNTVVIRVEPGSNKCYGEVTFRNVMHTMPIAFHLQPMDTSSYTVRPQSGIIPPLAAICVEIVYLLRPGSTLPHSFPHSDDSFVLQSVVVPGAVAKDIASTYDSIPSDWFTARKKQVFYYNGMKIMFVGSRVLAQLVVKGSVEDVRDVLEMSNPGWGAVDSVDAHGQTLLYLATSRNRADLVQLLLEFNPDIEARGKHGESVLEAAVTTGNFKIVELLLAQNCSTHGSSIHLAAKGGHIDILKLLLLNGANPNSLTKDGHTSLHIAIKAHQGQCVELLLDSGAIVNVGDMGSGNTPLHLASKTGNRDIVNLLLQNGANKDIRNRVGKTAYDVASEHGHTKLFDLLKFGDALLNSARKGEARTISWLIENDVSINGTDQHGWTALHRAAFKGQVTAVRAILSTEVDIEAKDKDGYTALHCATESGQIEVIELLIKKGADVHSKTNKGIDAIQIAESFRYNGISQILTRGGLVVKAKVTPVDAPAPSSFRNAKDKQLPTSGSIKRKSSRGRAHRRSFDSTIALTVS